MTDTQTPRTQKVLTVAVLALLVIAIACGALGIYASQRAHSAAVESYCTSGALVNYNPTTGYKWCSTGDLRSKAAQGLGGPLGYSSRWYWSYAAGAAGVAMLVAMFLLAVHPSRRRPSQGGAEQKGGSEPE